MCSGVAHAAACRLMLLLPLRVSRACCYVCACACVCVCVCACVCVCLLCTTVAISSVTGLLTTESLPPADSDVRTSTTTVKMLRRKLVLCVSYLTFAGKIVRASSRVVSWLWIMQVLDFCFLVA